MSKRYIPEQRPIKFTPKVIQIPPVEGLIVDALAIIQSEVLKLSVKSATGKSLDLKEARVLQGYIKALVDLSKESRERAREDDFSKMSNDELIELVQNLIEKRAEDEVSDKDTGSDV